LESYSDYDAFVIIDGEFGQSLSVSPKEILMLLDKGKLVIGASSMGALRASELDIYGMVGLGWVYQRFASAVVRRDDEVAMIYSPVDFAPITVPMVNIEYWMESVGSGDRVSRSERARVIAAARQIFFADRTEERLMDALQESIGSQCLKRILAETNGKVPDIKSVDAEQAVNYATDVARAQKRVVKHFHSNGGTGETEWQRDGTYHRQRAPGGRRARD
jgi:hypothetical protein